MASTTTNKHGARYRYYVTAAGSQESEASRRVRVSAPELEAAVFQALGIEGVAGTTTIKANPEESSRAAPSLTNHLRSRIERIVLHPDRIEIIPKRSEVEASLPPILVPWRPKTSRRRRAVIAAAETAVRPIRAETRARLLDGIASARLWLSELALGHMIDTKALAAREGCSERHIRMTLNLAFLSPTIVKAAVEGTLPDGAWVVHLTKMPGCWREQLRASVVG